MKAGTWKVCWLSDEDLVSRWNDGEPIESIAAAAGITRSGVSRRARKLGCPRRQAAPQPKRVLVMTPAITAKAKKMWDAGKSHAEIAKACGGRSPSWAYNLTVRMGWVRVRPEVLLTKRCEDCYGWYAATPGNYEKHDCEGLRQSYAA